MDAQDDAQQPKDRPKVGLALEGGGALGLAHVGLIQWFEQHHIPIDYIAGSSMGGLVSGFYASGMSGTEMQATVEQLNWNELVAGETDDQKLSFRRKEDVRTLGNSSVLGLRHGLIIPTGLNSGTGLNLLLSRVALPYSQMKSFDDLPTPYRTIATDIVKADAHIFHAGSLAEAMRATMSIPGLFDPVIDGTHEFVDGGLLNNLPVDVVKRMGADIVIAVYLDTDPFNPNAPQTAFTVLSRTLSAVVAANEKRNIEAADLLITVNCSGFTAGSFEQYRDLIKRGYEGPAKKEALLSKLRLDDNAWSEFLQQRAARRRTKVDPPEFVEVRGVNGSLAENVRSFFTSNIGKPFSASVIEAQISQVMGTNMFAYMSYQAVIEQGRPGLLVFVHPSPSRPPTLQPAFLVDGSDYQNTRFAMEARLTALHFGGFRSELRNDFIFGSIYGVRTEFFHPFRALSPWFIAPRAFAETRPFDIYRRSQILALYRRRNLGGGVDLGYSFGNTAELRVGYEASKMTNVLQLGDNLIYPRVEGRYGATHMSFTFDRLDDEIIPHNGIFEQADLRWVDTNPGTTKRLPVLQGSASYFHPLTQTSTFVGSVGGGTTFGRNNDGIPLFFLGGPQQLSAYGLNELYGNQYFIARIGYLKQIAVLSPFTGSRAYFLADYEVGKMYGFADSTRLPMDVNAGILVRTLLGPLFVGASTGDAGHRKWYFQIGRFF